MPDEKMHVVDPVILQRSRELRHPLTPPERKIWARVRNGQLGFKIRRQHPIWRFITDFYCAEAKLVIEIDGSPHAAPRQRRYDAARTAWLEARGYHVIRFWNSAVEQQLEAVLEAIAAECRRRAPAGEAPDDEPGQ